MEADGNDECSSYSTFNSNEGEVGKHVEAPEEGVLVTLRTLEASNASVVASMATMVASHGAVIEKLTSLEKAVGNVQSDMNAVHNAIMKDAQNVTDPGKLNAEMDRQQGVECDEFTQKEPWKGKGRVEEGSIAEPRNTSEERRACTPEENAGENGSTFEDGGYISDTHNHTQYAERPTHIASSLEDEHVSDWEAECAAALGQCTQRGTQGQTRLNVDAAEEESQQLALSCPSAQQRTPATGDKMWTDFRTAVELWPPLSPQGHGRQAGWVSAKRGRAASPGSEEDTMDTSGGTCEGDNSALNLNEPPEKVDLYQAGIVHGHVPSNGDIASNKRGGRGGGRGAGRSRRPPPMQPRYLSTVSRLAG